MQCKKLGKSQFIRVEHSVTGVGIWRSKDEEGEYHIDQLSNFLEFNLRHQNFPTLYREFYGTEWCPDVAHLDEYFCAFKGVTQLLQWISKEELLELFEFGFNVWLIESSECLEGEYQIAFKPEHVLSKINISSIFK